MTYQPRRVAPDVDDVLRGMMILRRAIQADARKLFTDIGNRPKGAPKYMLRERMAELRGMCKAYNHIHGKGRPLLEHDRDLYQLVADVTESADRL